MPTSRRPHLAGATSFSWPALFGALAPWVLYGIEQMPAPKGTLETSKDEKKLREEIARQWRTILDVLGVFRTATSETYFEDGVLVTHGETVIRYLEK